MEQSEGHDDQAAAGGSPAVPPPSPAVPPPPPPWASQWMSVEDFPLHPHSRPDPPPEAGTAPAVPTSGAAEGDLVGGPVGGPVAERPPAFAWRWKHVVYGSLMALGPQLLLSLPAISGGDASSTTKATSALAVFTLIVSLMMYSYDTFSAWLFSRRYGHQPWSAWGLVPVGKAIFWMIPAAYATVFVVGVINQVIIDPPQQEIVDIFPHSAIGVVCFFLTVCVAAPFFEEVFFRGFVYKGLANSWGPVLGAIVSAALFSAMHLQLTIFVPLFALGLALAWMYQRTGSLWANIAFHATWNGVFFLVWVLGG